MSRPASAAILAFAPGGSGATPDHAQAIEPWRGSPPSRADPICCSEHPYYAHTFQSMKTPLPYRSTLLCLTGALLLAVSGCGKRDDGRIEATTPKEAASGLEKAFQEAPAPVQDNVRVVSDAMRRGEYEKAVISLQAVRQESPKATLEQGMAVHGAMVSMESQLIQAIQSGDANAARAYELLRALKRK